ncbi:MAG TPA: hypothetical protein VM598_04405 [Bdellovibrionota bacterium]|nr:hypothetical protein [Bdellovibrionota bacterium]
MNRLFAFLLAGFICLFSIPAQAALSPIGLAILAPVQFPPRDFDITGARVSALWGRHRQVYGLDVGGIGNFTDQDQVGVSVAGGFNSNGGPTTIIFLQAAGVTNVSSGKYKVFGIQVAGLVNYQKAESVIAGFQIAAIANYSPFAKVAGAQVGIYNRANTVSGFQIGVVNVTEHLHGIQIGLLNFNRHGIFGVAPILNVGF